MKMPVPQQKPINQEDQSLEAHRLILMNNLKILEREAAIYFGAAVNPNRWAWDEERSAKYAAFKKSYFKLYNQLKSPESLYESKTSDEKKIGIFVAANQIAADTTVLLNSLSKRPAEDADAAKQANMYAEKVKSVQQFQHKHKMAASLMPTIRKYSDVIFTLCSAAIGFIAGGAVGAVVGVIEAAPFSLEPHIGIAAAIAGAVAGAVLGGMFGYKMSSRFSFFQQTPVEKLNTKAAKLGSCAEQFFPAPKTPCVQKPAPTRVVVNHPADLYVAMRVM